MSHPPDWDYAKVWHAYIPVGTRPQRGLLWPGFEMECASYESIR